MGVCCTRKERDCVDLKGVIGTECNGVEVGSENRSQDSSVGRAYD